MKGGWDTWTFRYNIYGLLFYEKYFPDDKVVDAYSDAFHPEKINVEGCCDATWIQLNTHLFELTGDAKFEL